MSILKNTSEIDRSNIIVLWNDKFDIQFHQTSSFDGNILIHRKFQVFVSLLLCILGSIGGLFHLRIFIQQYLQTKTFAQRFFIQFIFDCCHLLNILLTHLIVLIVYIKTSTNFDLYCPLSTLLFSIVSFASISCLCLEGFYRYMFLFRQQSQYRSLAHRFILITAISWLILHFPKFDWNDKL